MTCPKCGGQMKITRSCAGIAVQGRRRKCVVCYHQFFTAEKPIDVQSFYQIRAHEMRSYRARTGSRYATRKAEDGGIEPMSH